ncbi:RE1 [Symbiodinium sp. CCMP2592]|nr:RE1 [Symbiodinium sp. CCMP2592]
MEAQRPRVEIDYSFLKTDGTRATEGEAAEVILSAWDESTGMATAASLPAKNHDLGYVCRWLGEFIANLGHVKVTIRTDGEPAILNIARRLADTLRSDTMVGAKGIRATLETAFRYSSQSMGGVGSFQHTLKTDVLTLRYDVESRYNFALNPGHNLWPWMVRWASFIRSRFGVKANGRTAYQDAFDTTFTGDILPFGETAMFRMPASKTGAVQGRKRILKGDSLWRQGIFLSLRRLPPGQRAGKELMAGPRRLSTTTGGREALAAGETPEHTASQRGADLAVPPTPGDVPGTPPVRAATPKSQTDRAEGAQTDQTEGSQTDRAEGPQTRQTPLKLPAAKHGRKERDVAEKERRDTEDAKIRAESVSTGSGVKRVPAEAVEELEEHEVGQPDIEDDWAEDDEEELDTDAAEYEQEVREGKNKELSKMDKYDTYEPRPASEAEGKKILDSTWVVTRRPTGEVKCRYCLRDLKRGKKRDDVFAVASSQATARVIDTVGVKKGYVFFTADAENAYWQVPIKEEVFLWPPTEWIEQRRAQGLPCDGLVWKLKKEWYGRQIAGQSFVDWAAQQAGTEGFDRCAAAPWFFYNAARDASMEVHMDDFYSTAPEREATEFLESLSKKIVMKYKIHRPGDTFEHLKRIRTVHEDGMMVKANPKYLQAQTKDLKPDVFLDEQKAFEYRSCVGKALYLSFDRPDCQHAVRELTKHMKQPTAEAMNSLRRLARYLKGTCDMGGVFMVGGCLVGSYSRGLAMICLSSGEAEFNGGVMATSEGIFYKEGVGKIRHLETKALWVQQGLKEKKFSLHAISTETNPSDIHTKSMAAARFEILRKLLGVINDEAVEKAARATLLCGMLVGSVRNRVPRTAGGGTLAAILLAAGTGTAHGQGLQPGGAGNIKLYLSADLDYTKVILTALCCIIGSIVLLLWWWCKPKKKKKVGVYEDVYPVAQIEGPYILRTGSRMHTLSSCPHVQGRPVRTFPICEYCHRHTVQKYEKID